MRVERREKLAKGQEARMTWLAHEDELYRLQRVRGEIHDDAETQLERFLRSTRAVPTFVKNDFEHVALFISGAPK